MSRPTEQPLCPSAPATDGAILVGVVGPSGQVAYVQPLIQVDADFVERARAHGPPEERFRFSSPCVEGGCGYWTGSACGVIEQVLGARTRGDMPAAAQLPHCMIRQSCRWYAQAGSEACLVCPFVVTKTSRDGVAFRMASVPTPAASELTGRARHAPTGAQGE